MTRFTWLLLLMFNARLLTGQTVGITTTSVNNVQYSAAGYGAKCDNTSNDAAAIQAAVNAASAAGGGHVILPIGQCYTGTTTLLVPKSVTLEASDALGKLSGTTIRYGGSTDAIDLRGATYCGVKNVYVHTTSATANGIHMGNNSQHCRLENVFVDASSTSGNTGTGLLLDGASTNTLFSGHLVISGFYAIGYKYGIKWTGFTDNQQWTTVDISNVFLLGPAKASGSIGFWMTGDHSGGGCFIHAGTVESFDKAMQFDDGVIGCDMTIDLEANNTNQPIFGKSANVWFHHSTSGDFYSQSNNATVNAFDKEKRSGGIWLSESRGNRYHVTWDDTGTTQEWGWKRGASVINGGSPANAFVVHTSTSDDLTNPQRNYISLFSGTTESFGTAPPAGGNWVKGSIVWNTDPSPGGVLGWVCTTAGTPGVWSPIGYVSNSTSSNSAKLDALQIGASGTSISDSRKLSQFTAGLTTTAASSDTVAIAGVTSSSRCSLTPTNSSAATNLATTYISAKKTNQLTVTHTATSGLAYDILCSGN